MGRNCQNFQITHCNSGFDENDSDLLQIDKRDECKNILTYKWIDNRSKFVFGYFNINLICNKFKFLSKQVKGNIDVLMVSETKVNDCFHIRNFLIGNFSTQYHSY